MRRLLGTAAATLATLIGLPAEAQHAPEMPVAACTPADSISGRLLQSSADGAKDEPDEVSVYFFVFPRDVPSCADPHVLAGMYRLELRSPPGWKRFLSGALDLRREELALLDEKLALYSRLEPDDMDAGPITGFLEALDRESPYFSLTRIAPAGPEHYATR